MATFSLSEEVANLDLAEDLLAALSADVLGVELLKTQSANYEHLV